jgi:hypothetical protein
MTAFDWLMLPIWLLTRMTAFDWLMLPIWLLLAGGLLFWCSILADRVLTFFPPRPPAPPAISLRAALLTLARTPTTQSIEELKSSVQEHIRKANNK